MTSLLLTVSAALWPLFGAEPGFTVPQPQHPYGAGAVGTGAAIFHFKQPYELKHMIYQTFPVNENTRHFSPREIPDAPITLSGGAEEQQAKRHSVAIITPLPHREVIPPKIRRFAFFPEEPELPPGNSLKKAPLWVEHIPTKSKHKFTITNLGQSQLVMQQFYKGSNGGKPYVTADPNELTTTTKKSTLDSQETKEIVEKIIKQQLNKAKIAKLGRSAGSGRYDENVSGLSQPAVEKSGYSGGLSALPEPKIPNSVLTNQIIEEPSTTQRSLIYSITSTRRPIAYSITPPFAPPTTQVRVTTTTTTSYITSSLNHSLCGTSGSTAAAVADLPPVTNVPRTVEYALSKNVDGAVMGRQKACVPCTDSVEAPAPPITLAPIPPLPPPVTESPSAPPSIPNHIPLNPAPYEQPSTHPGSVPNPVPPTPVLIQPENPVAAPPVVEVAPATMPASGEREYSQGSHEISAPAPSQPFVPPPTVPAIALPPPESAPEKLGQVPSAPVAPTSVEWKSEGAGSGPEKIPVQLPLVPHEAPAPAPAPAPIITEMIASLPSVSAPAPAPVEPAIGAEFSVPAVAAVEPEPASVETHPAPSTVQTSQVIIPVEQPLPSEPIENKYEPAPAPVSTSAPALAVEQPAPAQIPTSINMAQISESASASGSYSAGVAAPSTTSTSAPPIQVPASVPSSSYQDPPPARPQVTQPPLIPVPEETAPAFVQTPATSAESSYSNIEEENTAKVLVPVPVPASAYKEVAPLTQTYVGSSEERSELPQPNPPQPPKSSGSYLSSGSNAASSTGSDLNSGSSSSAGASSFSTSSEIIPAPSSESRPSTSYSTSYNSVPSVAAPSPQSTSSEEPDGSPQYINEIPAGSHEQSHKESSHQISFVPETAPSLPESPGEVASETSESVVGPSSESSYSNLEEDHEESEGPLTVVDTESNNVHNNGPVSEVNQETGSYQETNYEIPAKITPIQVSPSSYNVVPGPIQPIQPFSPRSVQGVGYQQPSGVYQQPQQSFQPPPPYLQPPPPLPLPQAPVFQPQPTYQAPAPAVLPQQGCCGGQLFSPQGGICMPLNFNPCQSQLQQRSIGGCGACSPTCASACIQPAPSCGGGNCCVARSPSCCPQPMSSLCCNQVIQSCCQPQQRQCCNAQSSSCCPNPFQGCCCNRSQVSGLCRQRRFKRSVGRILGICGS